MLNVLIHPNPILRNKNESVKLSNLPKLQDFFAEMIETMYKADGIGLAAPQVGKNLRVATINKMASFTKEDLVLLNPKIVNRSWRRIVSEEACLSLPGVTKIIKRHNKVKISAWNQKGEKISFTAEGYSACVMQHELDHLDGILIIDHEDVKKTK